MNAGDILRDTRVAHVRELKTEVARLKEDLAVTRGELASLKAHFALAVLAAADVARLPPGGGMVIIDGWNAALDEGSDGDCRAKRERLSAIVRARAAENPRLFFWLVFDGADARATSEERLRISYTGGTGAHRADRMICDFLRMMKLSGQSFPVRVVTNDKDFAAEAARLGAQTLPTHDFKTKDPDQWN